MLSDAEQVELLMAVVKLGGFDQLPESIRKKLDDPSFQSAFESVAAASPLQPPTPIEMPEMSLSLSEYYSIISDTMGLKNVESGFWVVVMRIVYLMMSIEKDPGFAAMVRKEIESPEKLLHSISKKMDM
jgi:hypothetical protein